MLQSYFALIPGFCKMRNPLDEQPATNYSSHKKHLGFGIQPSIIQAEWSREVLVLVSLVHRCCYCSRGALLLFLPGWSRQDRIIQHFTVACHPCHFGSCNGRQHLVALGRATRSRHRSCRTAGDPRNSVCTVHPPPRNFAPELSLTHPAMKIDVARLNPLNAHQQLRNSFSLSV